LNEEDDYEDNLQDAEEEDDGIQENLNYEPGSHNFETDERETHKRNIPTPHSDPNDQEVPTANVIHAYIPSFANNSQNLRRVPFKAQD
jgi:hypothetical protein